MQPNRNHANCKKVNVTERKYSRSVANTIRGWLTTPESTNRYQRRLVRRAHMYSSRHCFVCKINLYRSWIRPGALARAVRANAACECCTNRVADRIGSEVRILDRIEQLTAETDLTARIDRSRFQCLCLLGVHVLLDRNFNDQGLYLHTFAK